VETAIPPILEYLRKTNLYIHPIKQGDGKLARSKSRDEPNVQFTGPAGIVISTYSMIGITGKRAHDAEKVMQWIRSREWGFLLLDEVHVVPANTFRKCVNGFRVHAKLGLTGKLPLMYT
jgi:superfamily II DNA or RNA helicase